LERIYNRDRYLERKGEFKECKRSDRRIQEKVLARHGRHGTVRAQRRNVPMGRIARKIHGKEIIWMVRQTVRPRILGKIRKELETMEGQETSKKRDDEDDLRRRRN